MDKLLERLSSYCEIQTDVPCATLTTLRIGGNARYVAYPKNIVALDQLLQVIAEAGLPVKVFGKGSNILCSDADYPGVILRFDRYFNEFYFDGNTGVALAGGSIIALSYEVMKLSLSGLEFASGIPGTIGGVTFMNAGAYKSSMADIITDVFVWRNGRAEWLSVADCDFGYRHSIFQQHPEWIILAIRFQLEAGDQREIRELMDLRRQRRMDSQPLNMPSAGSIFRNPAHAPAWQMIETIGYRGKRIGDAMVSDRHANFIVNTGRAKASDFNQLIEEIQATVAREYQEELILEVEKFNW